ncbi:MAG TPA: hypothetical protein VFY27_12485 [Woeseiaceae bacterium]|nr:hypothetical protein [Woeseiaceae bacterium]
MFGELKAWIRYQLDGIFARSSISQFVLLVLLSLVIVLLGMTAYFFGLFSPQNQEVEGIGSRIDRGLWDSLWWSLKHLIEPGVFADNYGATAPVVLISLLIAIMGMVIFGILIGFISTSMESRLAALQKGNSPVKERGHILILGWSNKVIMLLRLLTRLKTGLRIVVLARPEIGHMQEALRAEGGLALPIKLVLRTGVPTNILELRRVAFEQASSIIVLADSARESDAAGRDVEAIKTAMLLSSFTGWRGPKPVLVSEINRKQNVEIARIAGRNEISVVSSSEVISKVIVQSARQSGLSFVYSEILSGAGNSIRVQRVPACAGKRFGDIQAGFADAVPIGVSWQQEKDGVPRYVAGLNPEPDYVIDADDSLVLLCRGNKASYDANAKPEIPAAARSESYRKPPLNRILVLGFNDNVQDILIEFDGHVSSGSHIDLVSNLEDEEARQRLEQNLTKPFRNIEVAFRHGSTVSAAFLRSLDVLSYDCIITLADESNEDDPDARSIMLLLLLSDIITSDPSSSRINVVSEIHDPANRELVARTAAQEVIVSPEIISMQLSQISQQPVLESIYQELLSAGGIEICIKPASRYVDLLKPCSFIDLQLAAQRMMEVVIGVRIHDPAAVARHKVQLNPRRETRWEFGPNDSVVVLAQEIYD